MIFLRDLYLSRKPLAGFLAIGIAFAVYSAQVPVIKANVGASDAVYGFALLIGALGAFAAMWLAPAARRLTGSLAMPLGIVITAIGMVMAGAAGSVPALTTALLLASAGAGIIDVLANDRVSHVESASGRALMNLNHGLYALAYAGGAFATGGLRSAGVDAVTIFVLMAAILFGLAVVAREEVTEPEDDTPDGTGSLLPNLLVALAGLTVFVAFLSEAVNEGWSALHLERSLGGSAAEGALGPALMGLTMAVGRFFGHGLARFIRDTYLMLVATLVSAAGIALAGLATSVPVALAGFALGGLGISVVAPLALALIGRSVPPATRLRAISRVSVIGYCAFFAGPPMMGLVAEGVGLGNAFVLVAALLGLSAAFLIPALARQMLR